MSADYLVIVNPNSAGGATGRLWPSLEPRLRAIMPPFDTVLTERAGDATRLAAEAAARYGVIVALGGDGTVNEVLNGLLAESGPRAPCTALGVVPGGTGSDFARSLGIPRDLEGAAAVLARGRRHQVDVGHVRFLDFGGNAAERFFINEAEVGIGAEVCRTVARSSRRLGGAAAYLWAIALTTLRYRDRPVSMAVDGGPPETFTLNNAWVANGRFSGSGIRSAPRARLDDGLLDLVRVSQARGLSRVVGFAKLRSGAFVDMPHVDYRTVRRVEVIAPWPAPVETDGEPVGTVPATFEVLPGRLSVIA